MVVSILLHERQRVKSEISSNTERENKKEERHHSQWHRPRKKKACKNASSVKYIILQHSVFWGLVRSEYSNSQTHAGKNALSENVEGKKITYINDDDIKTF